MTLKIVLAALICLTGGPIATLAQSCGATLYRSGVISTPGYPSLYRPNTFCLWRLQADPLKVVQLTVSDFRTEYGYDILRCYETANASYSTPFRAFSGYLYGSTTLCGNAVTCLFNSDESIQDRGFYISFTSVDARSCSPVTLPVTTPPSLSCGGSLFNAGSIVSPNYPAAYPAGASCRWLLTTSPGSVISLQFNAFSTETLWDSVRVSCTSSPSTTLAQYSGYIRTFSVAFACNLTVTFKADSSIQYNGFSISFSSKPASTVVPYSSPLPASCGVPSIPPSIGATRIVGGNMAVANSWPWQVMLTIRGAMYCGGSLIDRLWVLTAAHCVDGLSLSTVSVVAGKHSINATEPGQITVAPAKAIVYPLYDRNTHNNDLALIKLAAAVTFSRTISPVCLSNSDYQTGTTAYATGWGDTTGLRNISRVLMQVAMPLLDPGMCSLYLGSQIKKSMICAGQLTGGKDTCQGDSGGPLVVRTSSGTFEQVGVTSWGKGCAGPVSPGVYTRVSGFVGWIQSVMTTY